MPTTPRVEYLSLDCSIDQFLSKWHRSHAVLLRRPQRRSSRRAGASSSADAPNFAAMHAVLRRDCKGLEACFTVEGGASSKRKRDDAPPDTANALLAGESLPGGTFYCSLVVSRKPALVASLLSSTGAIAPPCFAQPARREHVQQESALWLFIGSNAHSSQALPGRPLHTDAVEHTGTFHRQVEGRKEWTLRPTEELCAALRGRGVADADEDDGGMEAEGDMEAEEAEPMVVTCETGDVLVLSTADWWHSTRLPPTGVSVSVAREFNLVAGPPKQQERGGRSRGRSSGSPGRRSKRGDGTANGAAAASEGDASADDEAEEEATSFINVEGLFASRAIAEGTVLFTEEDDCDLRLPEAGRPGEANVCVAEDEESGLQCVVATRDIRSGEFLAMEVD